MRFYRFDLIAALLTILLLSGCNEGDQQQEEEVTASATGSETRSIAKPSEAVADTGLDLAILSVAEHPYDGGTALAVVLSSSLDGGSDHQGFLQVTDAEGKRVDSAWVLSTSGKQLYFPHIEPNTEYRVTLYQGLRSEAGAILRTTEHHKLKTRDLHASIGFVGKGSLLPAKVSRGLPVFSVNVDEVDINLHRVSADSYKPFFEMTNGGGLERYWRLQSLDKMTKLVHSGRYTLNPVKNRRREFNIPISNISALKQPGVYVAVMRAAGSYNRDHLKATYFTVTDIGLHARFYGDRLDTHLSSLSTGEVMVGVKVELLDDSGMLLEEGLSTPEGLVVFSSMSSPERRNARYIAAQQDEFYTVLDIKRPALDLSDFNVGDRPHRPVEAFLYGPRDLYRPGETVVVSALLRDHDGKPVKTVPLQARYRRPDGEIARAFVWHSEQAGYFESHYQLERDAPTGSWTLVVDHPGGYSDQYPFQVEEFLPERMKLVFNEGSPQIPVTDPVEPVDIRVFGEYLYGAPAAGNRLESELNISLFREPLAQWRGFQFGNLNERDNLQRIPLQDLTLDADGRAVVHIDSQWKNSRSPLKLNLQASLYESGGRPVSRRYTHLVWPGGAMVGIRPGFDKESKANTKALFEVILAGRDGVLLANSRIDAQLIREDRQYFWEWSGSEGWHYEQSESEYPVAQRSLLSDQQRAVKLELPVEYGHYRLELTYVDTGAKTSLRFHAGRDWYYWWRHDQMEKGEAARPDAVALSFDKPSYRPGETAQLKIVSPADAQGLVLIESDRPLWSRRVALSKAGTTVSIPVGEDWDRHDIYASVVAFHGADNKAKVSSQRVFGLARLPLEREQRRLEVVLEAPARIRPNQRLGVKVKVDNLAADSRAWVTLAAVDVGVLNITGFETPDPFDGYFGQRRYSIDSRDIYDRVIALSEGETARMRFGGDAELSRGGERPLSEVRIVSLFSGLVSLNGAGEAEIPLDLPDFNGRLRLMAVAFSEHSYGHSEKEVTVAAALVSQLSMPRFMAPGDSATLALDLHNLSDREQHLQLQMDTAGPLNLEPAVQRLTLAAGEKTTLGMTAKATGGFGVADIQLTITGLQEQGGEPLPISRDWQLGVRPGWPAQTQRITHLLSRSSPEFNLPATSLSGLLADTVQLQLNLSDTPGLDLQRHLDGLLQYPYGCLEQTASRIYPLLFASGEKLSSLGLNSGLDPAERLQRIEQGLDRLRSMQKSGGGYGLWSKSSNEEHWLTAYVGDLLLAAGEQGTAVAGDQLEKTLKRLERYLQISGRLMGQRHSDNPAYYAFATKAYAAYVLAKVRRAPLGVLRTLYEREGRKLTAPLPLLQLGLALKQMGDIRRADKVIGEALNQSRLRKEYRGDYGSRLRDTASMIHLLLSHREQTEAAYEMAIDLAGQLKQRSYLSTQERNTLFLAGMALSGETNEPWQAQLAVGDETHKLSQRGGFSQLFRRAAIEQGIAVSTAGERELYLTALVNGYSAEPPTPTDGDIELTRSYYDLDGNWVEPSELQEGELLIAHLALSAKERHPDMLVVDLLAAGLELENPNLPTSIPVDERVIEGKSIRQWQQGDQIIHQEYRDDRYIAAVDVRAGSEVHLFYAVRAVTPGTYRLPPPYAEDMYNPEQFVVGEQHQSYITVMGK